MIYLTYTKKKTSKIKTFLQLCNGIFLVNNKSIKKYFGNILNLNIILIPLIIINVNNINIKTNVKGGGISSQLIGIRIGICKCILMFNYKFYNIFRKLNFITIDDRKVERKKYGKKKSRKSEQYSKR